MMTGEEMAGIRRRLILGRLAFGVLLGYGGEDKNIVATITRYEENKRDIPPIVEGLLRLLNRFYVDHGYIPDLDDPALPEMRYGEVVDVE